MTQNASDVEIANQGFAAFRQDLNDVLEDITTLHSGTAAPSTTYANQWWYETDTDKLYIRNEDNDAWIEILTLDQANDHLATIGASITLDGTGNVSIDSGDFTVDTDTLHVDSTNNRVGIGTSSSLEGTLHVESVSNNNIIMDAPANRFNSIGFQTAGVDKWWLGRADSDQISGDAFFIGIDSGNATDAGGLSDKLVITQSGNVGIGTDSPAHELTVKNATQTPTIRIHSDTDSFPSPRLEFVRGTNDTFGADVYTDFVIVSDSGHLLFQKAASGTTEEVMRLLNNGHVSIGSTSDLGILYVASGENTRIVEQRSSNSSYSGQILRQKCNRAGSSSYYFLLASSNNTADNEAWIRGDGKIAADSGFQTGADYAEFFEWDDGNSSDEDRRGYSVVLTNGNKIRKATSSDAASDIIGVISGHPSVVGDAAWSSWGGKFNRDDFGGYIWETYTVTEWTEAVEDGDDIEHSYQTDQIPSDVTVPADATVITQDDDGNTLKRKQVNSSYDDTQTYTPREDRQEWDAVGMVGKLRLRVGQPTGNRWIKMRDIATDDDGNVTVEEWLVR